MRCVWLGPVLLLAACHSPAIEVRDSGVFQAGGRLLVRSDPGESGAWQGLLLEADWLEDEDEQGLAAGEVVELDGVSFFGAQELEIEYALRRECLAYAIGTASPELDVEGHIELGYARVVSTLELAGSGQRAKEHDTWDGFHAACSLLWAPTVVLGLEGRLTTLFDLDDIGSDLQTIELGTRLFPRAPVGLFAGWRWIEEYRSRDDASDLDLRSSGPMVALRVTL
jgi:hypothetical protein